MDLEIIDSHHLKRTKMICTIGPATDSYESLEKLVHIGMNGARLNFSHGNYDEFSRIIHDLREISTAHKKPIAIIQDLQGPKIRVGSISEALLVHKDDYAYLGTGPDTSLPSIPIQFDFTSSLKTQHAIYFNDGYVKARVEEVGNAFAKIIFLNEGTITSNQGINLPDTIIPHACLTEKDMTDLAFGLGQDIDYVALSFIQTAEDIEYAKDMIHKTDSHVKIVAKIETKNAVEHIEHIIDASDVVMVARGDLAVEVGLENVPIIQNDIVKLCKLKRVPVIIATQMLESMIENPRPTRAEVSDVANAAMQEVDAVMLSAESAIGKYPFQAAEMMRSVIKTTENRIIKDIKIRKLTYQEMTDNCHAISYAATLIANQMDSDLLAVATKSGRSALSISALRPNKTLIAVAQSKKVYNQLSLVWGIKAFLVEKEMDSIDELVDDILILLKDSQYISKGSKVIFVTGLHIGVEGGTNSLRIIDINE